MSGIPDTPEVELKRIEVQGEARQKVSQTLFQQIRYIW
jgi:translation initiation factor 1 (eIF-1/SUI1)